jgi:hypothetical protein
MLPSNLSVHLTGVPLRFTLAGDFSVRAINMKEITLNSWEEFGEQIKNKAGRSLTI